MVRIIAAIVISFSLSTSAFAQGAAEEGVTKKSGPRRQLATIIFCGLGGAVLGLSTLSFYGRPQDKLSNIAIGFAVGVIGGTAYVTYQAATQPSTLSASNQDPHFQGLANLQKPLAMVPPASVISAGFHF